MAVVLMQVVMAVVLMQVVMAVVLMAVVLMQVVMVSSLVPRTELGFLDMTFEACVAWHAMSARHSCLSASAAKLAWAALSTPW